jgi:hypothetical protein
MYFILAIMIYVLGISVVSAIDSTYGLFVIGMIYYTWPISIFCIVVIWLILRALFAGPLGPPRS